MIRVCPVPSSKITDQRSHYSFHGEKRVKDEERNQNVVLGMSLPMNTAALPGLYCCLLPDSTTASGALEEPKAD